LNSLRTTITHNPVRLSVAVATPALLISPSTVHPGMEYRTWYPDPTCIEHCRLSPQTLGYHEVENSYDAVESSSPCSHAASSTQIIACLPTGSTMFICNMMRLDNLGFLTTQFPSRRPPHFINGVMEALHVYCAFHVCPGAQVRRQTVLCTAIKRGNSLFCQRWGFGLI
jgi:hypothetical protein